MHAYLKFRHFEKATKFEKMPINLTLLGNVKNIWRFFQKVDFSEYLKFMISSNMTFCRVGLIGCEILFFCIPLNYFMSTRDVYYLSGMLSMYFECKDRKISHKWHLARKCLA